MREDLLTTPTFIIGLGGVGQAITSIIMSRFLNSLWEGLPETVRVRSIDTTSEERHLHDIRIYQIRSFTQLGNFNAGEVVQNLHLFPEIQKWWKYDLNPQFISFGAAAQRPVGRLVFFHKIRELCDCLREDFHAPLSAILQNKLVLQGLDQVKKCPRVFITGSLAGGTCSGMFLDMAIVVRKLLEDCGYDRGGIEITGVFGLPSVIELASKDGQTDTGTQRRVNTFGALRELDYFACGAPLGQDIEYPSPVGKFSPTGPIFNQTYLFTAKTMQSFGFDTQEQVFTRVAHFIFGQVALTSGKHTQDILVNHRPYFSPDQRTASDGLKAIYGSIGVEWLEVPRQHLVAKWSSQMAGRIRELVADFEWTKQPKVNLGQAFRERLSGPMQAYRKALELIEAGPLGIENMENFRDLSIYINQIQECKKPDQLTASINAFQTGLSGIVSSGKRSFSKLSSKADEAEWLRDTFALIADRRFRLGGAKRFLEESAEQLRSLATRIEASNTSAEDIVKQCTEGLFRKKVNPAAAVEWAKIRVYRAVRDEIRQLLGDRASSLALRCDALVELLRKLQDSITKATESLITSSEERMSFDAQTSLLEPSDMDEVLKENLELVANEIADRVAGNVTQELRRESDPAQGFNLKEFEASFANWVKDSIEHSAAQRTKRPDDAIARLKARMSQCQPLAEIYANDSNRLELMSNEQVATPLKIVITSIADERRAELEDWAKLEKRNTGSPNAFQVFPTEDRLRDDVVHITMGWPLWLFKEVRYCADASDHAKNYDQRMYQASFVMNEFTGNDKHDVRPMSKSEAMKWFGVALSLSDIKQVGSAIAFTDRAFGNYDEISEGSFDEKFQKAFERFRRQGYSWKYAKHIENERRLVGDNELRSRIENGAKERREALETSKARIPDPLYNQISDYYSLAEKFAEGLFSI